jgi:hypothetical protein
MIRCLAEELERIRAGTFEHFEWNTEENLSSPTAHSSRQVGNSAYGAVGVSASAQ